MKGDASCFYAGSHFDSATVLPMGTSDHLGLQLPQSVGVQSYRWVLPATSSLYMGPKN